MDHSILYFGDDDQSRAAIYLSGILEHYALPYERVDSDQSPDAQCIAKPRALYILSDYPRERFAEGQLEHIRDAVENQGSGLLMIGGWESFHGRNGEYHQTVLKDVLPVEMESQDDRRNFYQPIVLRKRCSHEILDGLPWEVPPMVGGFNLFKPKPDTTQLLDGVRLDLRLFEDDNAAVEDCSREGVCSIDGHALLDRVSLALQYGGALTVSEVQSFPMLVLGQYGRGRTAAFAGDVAPHWVGGLVDWGDPDKRVTQSVGQGFIEVGNHYATFFRNLVLWTAGE